MQIFQNNKWKISNIYAVIVLLYVISAIAFEITSNTAYISTLAIYLVFVCGIAFVLFSRKTSINSYVATLVMLCAYSFALSASPLTSSAIGVRIAYLLTTCSVLGIIIYWLSSQYVEIIHMILTANIVGSLILVYRIISIYGGISQVITTASSSGENRIGKLIGNENAIGLFLAGGVLSCVCFLFMKKRAKPIKLLLLACASILGAMVLLTGSRKSLVFVVVGVVLYSVLYNQKANILKKLSVYVAIVAVLLVFINVVSSAPIFSTIYTRFELLIEGFFNGSQYTTDLRREEMISTGMSEFWKSPLFGRGTGRSYEVFGTYSHNNFVEILMSYGIIGFIIYYVPYTFLLVRLFKRACRRDIYAIYFFVYVSMQILLGIGWVNYYERVPQLMTAAAWGYLAYCKTNDEVNESEAEELI